MNKISQSKLRELFDYSPLTGKLIWKVQLSNRAPIGSVAGPKADAKGYYRAMIDGTSFRVCRLVWIFHNGDIPEGLTIDHRDTVRGNDKIANLRLATYSQNNSNKSGTKNKLGLKGVKKNGKRFQARISIKNKKVSLGTFDTAEEAHEIYKKKAKEIYGDFANVA